MQRILSSMRKAIEAYHMIEENDKIAVCISGGKDSITLLHGLKALQRFYPKHFELIAISVNPGFDFFDTELLQQSCDEIDVHIKKKKSDIKEIVFNIRKEKNPCSLCANLRRGIINTVAIREGCNKIALGHHFNDVIETTLLSMLYGSEIKTMMPKLHSENFEGLELIRPLFLVKEDAIIAWAKHNELRFLNCACRFTEKSSYDESLSKRKEVKNLIKEMKKTNENADYNIFKALDNVNIDCILGYKKNKEYHNFLDDYL